MSKVDEGPFSWVEDIWRQIFCGVSGTLSCVSAHRVHALRFFSFPANNPDYMGLPFELGYAILNLAILNLVLRF
jgi:hypothetical protein